MAERTSDYSQENGNLDIMRELSTIKTTLAVATSETVNIKNSITEIKIDIKEIKSNYINQEQHKTLVDCASDHEVRLRSVESNITRILTYGSAFLILLSAAQFILSRYF